jgi:ATP-dependent Clp protease adaptor protein ClpS
MAEKNDPQDDGQLLTRKRSKTRKPRLYKVFLHNDDYTPMEFVVAVLRQVFHLGDGEATQVMLLVHNAGVGLAGTFSYEIAETKVQQVLNSAQRHEFPLQCSMEPE